jgi:hypothetical protein
MDHEALSGEMLRQARERAGISLSAIPMNRLLMT